MTFACAEQKKFGIVPATINQITPCRVACCCLVRFAVSAQQQVLSAQDSVEDGEVYMLWAWSAIMDLIHESWMDVFACLLGLAALETNGIISEVNPPCC